MRAGWALGALWMSACSFSLSLTASGSDAGPDQADSSSCAWTAGRALVFANASRSEDLVSFPILVALEEGLNFEYAGTAPGGSDLRFRDADGMPLSYEIEHWDPQGRSYVWVEVPKIDASSDLDRITMYYGNPNAMRGDDRPGVWDGGGYVGVWHFAEDPTAIPARFADSSPSANDATAAAMATPAAGSGPLGAALDFDGIDDRLVIASSASLNLASMTLEAWVRLDSPALTGWRTILEHDRDGPSWYGLWTSANAPGHFHIRWSNGANPRLDFMPTFVAGQWHYVVGTLDQATTTARTFQDGIVGSTTPTGTPALASGTGVFQIGQNSINGEPIGAVIDEIRISNLARSPAWIDAQYASVRGTLITYAPPSPPLACPE